MRISARLAAPSIGNGIGDHHSNEVITMELRRIGSKIGDAASRTRNLVAKISGRFTEVADPDRNAASGAEGKLGGLANKGRHRLQENATKAGHVVQEIAAKVLHSAQEAAQKAVHGAREANNAADHRRDEVADGTRDARKQQ
jgi:hypothetical protein